MPPTASKWPSASTDVAEHATASATNTLPFLILLIRMALFVGRTSTACQPKSPAPKTKIFQSDCYELKVYTPHFFTDQEPTFKLEKYEMPRVKTYLSLIFIRLFELKGPMLPPLKWP
jgi:hypothetical protein